MLERVHEGFLLSFEISTSYIWEKVSNSIENVGILEIGGQQRPNDMNTCDMYVISGILELLNVFLSSFNDFDQ